MKKNKLVFITLIVLLFQTLFVESLTINTIQPDFLVLLIIYLTQNLLNWYQLVSQIEHRTRRYVPEILALLQ